MNQRSAWLWQSASIATLAALTGLTGCSAIKVGLGMRTHLAKIPVTTMQASLPNGPAIAPGESSPLVVTFTDATGKVWVTEGKGKGKILWSDIAVTPSVVTVNKKGVLSLPHDPRKSDGKTGQVEITVPSHPELHASLTIPVRYDYPFVAHFDGAAGSSGSDGMSRWMACRVRAGRRDRAIRITLCRRQWRRWRRGHRWRQWRRRRQRRRCAPSKSHGHAAIGRSTAVAGRGQRARPQGPAFSG